jgi:tetratricopeptide (TPR) repeat protein
MYSCKSLFFITTVLLLWISGCGNLPSSTQPPTASISSAASAIPSIDPQSEQLFQKGLTAYEAFNYNEAISFYNKSLSIDKNNYKALSGKGIALAMRGNENNNTQDITSGITLIKNALQKNPNYVAAFYDLALALKINKNYDESICWFQKVIQKEPDNTWSYYGIATIYGDKGQAKEAVTYLKKAISFDSINVKQAARTQSHFDSIRSDPDFKSLVNE